MGFTDNVYTSLPINTRPILPTDLVNMIDNNLSTQYKLNVGLKMYIGSFIDNNYSEFFLSENTNLNNLNEWISYGKVYVDK